MSELTDAQILAELNGIADKAVPTVVDPPPAQAPSLAAQMEVAPPTAPVAKPAPRAQQLDKTHSKAAGGHGYKVWVKGEYYAKSTETKGNIIKRYRLPFNLPHLVNSKGEAALGIIVGKLLKSGLQKLDPLAITFRTHEVDGVEPLHGAPAPTSIFYMSMEALKDYVRKNLVDFPVTDLDDYFDVAHLREDVIDFKTNAVTEVTLDPGTLSERKVPGGFGVKKTASERIVERQAVRAEARELAAMNDGVEVGA